MVEPLLTLRLFASLREEQGWSERTVPLGPAPLTAAALQQQLGLTRRDLRIAVNQRFVAADQLLRAGDEVAFLPPITGG
ncbi:MAG: MoaD/ThiS family protein [Aphanocapsa feldmannii 277cV]|uniref:MoaD/ThiS family protein n=2 Tax=Aphanocapsa feldmannii TaxID=192050 RepID=A0A524RNC6_9CHRO|nr:MAG: MoaD/ThiS family protein [Aphanocapsa feldmannii 288cV]TGG92305.1 MAG: MoaD/ThiS family protein [Aphanocapsa feldmannii 277cV]TGH22488.1 MAG: MoaD/ThiS family protein [Aphanocapsa feldmannii 277cI]